LTIIAFAESTELELFPEDMLTMKRCSRHYLAIKVSTGRLARHCSGGLALRRSSGAQQRTDSARAMRC